MGKKKVSGQTAEEAIKEGAKIEANVSKEAAKGVVKKIETGRVYVNASYNNTTVSVTDEKGNVITWSSAGSLGFSGPKKATPFAASKVVSAITEKLRKNGLMKVHVFVSGVGGGRDATVRSLVNQGFDVLSIKDVTPIPHNGPRPPKVRRI